MAKKRKKSSKKRRGACPRVFRRIPRAVFRQYIMEQRAELYVGPAGCNPHDCEHNVRRFDGQLYVQEAQRFDDLSVPINRKIWCGSLGETALMFLINDFRNDTGYNAEPHFWVLDVMKMHEIKVWGEN